MSKPLRELGRVPTLVTILGLTALFVPLSAVRVTAQDERRPAKAAAPIATPLRLIDSEGRPVAGALVSTYFVCYRDRSHSFLPRQGVESRRSDARGEALLGIHIRDDLDGKGIFAIAEEPGEDRPLVGLSSITREQMGKPLTITMYPACRVRLRVECPGFREVEAKYNAELGGSNFLRAAAVLIGEPPRLARPLFANSTSGELEFLLPPGRYNLMIYGTNATSVHKPIEIAPGHRVRSLVVELSPSEAVQRGQFREHHHWIEPDPRGSLDGGAEKPRVLIRPVRVASLEGESRGTRGVAYSPDGNLFATAHERTAAPGEARLWDARTRALIARLPVPVEQGGVLHVAFSPDGKLLAGLLGELASSKPPGAIALWDVSTRQTLRTLRGHTSRISALAFSRDGGTLASGGEDQSVRLWDVADGREAGRIEQNAGWIRSLAFTADGKSLVIGSGETLKLWDIEGNRLRALLEPGGFMPFSCALSPNGRTLAVSGGRVGPGALPSDQVRLYDLSADPPACRAELVIEDKWPDQADDGAPFSSVAFTADGRRVVAIAMRTIVLWDATTGKLRDYFSLPSGGERLAASSNGHWLAISDPNQALLIDITPPSGA